MVVPIGMLQPPLFWSRPKSLTFGAFGIVVGKFFKHYLPFFGSNSQIGRLRRPFARPLGSTGKGIVHG